MLPVAQSAARTLCLLMLSAATVAWAGAGSSWSGSLRDHSGNPLANARIEIRAASGDIARDATTSAEGNFLINGLAAGTYRISVAYAQATWHAPDPITLSDGGSISTKLQLSSTDQSLSIQLTSQESSVVPASRDESSQASGGERLSGNSGSRVALNARD